MKQNNVATELLFTFCLVFIIFDVNGFSWMDSELKFSDGFSCDNGFGITPLADCYMKYFGFDHTGGFNGPQRSLIDLEPIFSFVKNYTSCDLINEPNSKCKRKRKNGKWRPYIDRNKDSLDSDEYPNQIPQEPGMIGHLKVKSKHNFVTISYKEDDDEGNDPFKPPFPGDDGPDFPLSHEFQNSFKVEKRGRFNPKYKIEINGYGGNTRVLLILTGKSKLWFRLHCYGCGAWVEVKSNCTERVIKYSGVRKESSNEASDNSLSSDESSDSSSSASYEHHDLTHKIIHVPLHFEDGCTLWKGGSAEQHQDRWPKDAKKFLKTRKKPIIIKKQKTILKQKSKKKAKFIMKTKTVKTSEIMTTTEVALEASKSKTFIDWILPPGVRRAVKKIPSIKHS